MFKFASRCGLLMLGMVAAQTMKASVKTNVTLTDSNGTDYGNLEYYTKTVGIGTASQ